MKKLDLIFRIVISLFIVLIVFEIEGINTWFENIVLFRFSAVPLFSYIHKQVPVNYNLTLKIILSAVIVSVLIFFLCIETIDRENLVPSIAESVLWEISFIAVAACRVLPQKYRKLKYPAFIVIYLLFNVFLYLINPVVFMRKSSDIPDIFSVAFFVFPIIHIFLFSVINITEILLFCVCRLYKKKRHKDLVKYISEAIDDLDQENRGM